jgi:arylsulfatase
MQYLTHRHRLTAGLLAAIATIALLCRVEAQSIESPLTGSKPNILVILTDDQGYGDTSGHGHPNLKTPNLDRLEREGRSFKNFFVSPTCSPTRSALMTGRHEFFNGVTHTILERERLTLDAVTIAQVLQQAGYRTGAFGKWHLGDEDPYQPNQRGFDESFIHGGGGIGQTFPGSCGDAPGNSYFNPTISHNGVFEKTQGYCTDVFFDRAQKFIASTQAQSDKQPFFCWLATNAPHDPYNAKPEDAARFASLDVDDKLKNFYGMIENIDENVGKMLKHLDALGIADSTLVIFMNDNGSAIGTQRYNAQMRGAKGSAWLGGTRANAFWRWPKSIAPGESQALTAHIDLFRTLAALAGVELNDVANKQAHGRSLLPLLQNPQADWEDRFLMTHFGRWAKGDSPDTQKYRQAAVRNTRYTLVSPQGSKKPDWQLYDVIADPGQSKNIANDHPEIVAMLSKEFESWWTAVQPHLVNEQAIPVTENPFKIRYRQQFPDPTSNAPAVKPPNILWVIVEDMSAHFGCYGEKTIQTPNVDALASRGTRFSKAFVTAPICSISRSALITGNYQTAYGLQNHRSSVPGHPIYLPYDTPLVPELFKQAGYHVNNLTWEHFLKDDAELQKNPEVPIAKTDYNFEWKPEKSYDKKHWAVRKPNQPFFVQIQLHGGKFRGQAPKEAWPARVLKELGSITSSQVVKLPAYLPEHPVIQEDWAQYLDCVRYTDYQLGTIIDRLKQTGELDDTVIFFMTDHGISHVRNKQFLYDGGTHVPLVIAGPGVAAGKLREDLVEHIDLGATSLAMAGIAKPGRMNSQDILGATYKPREAVFAARDRADETVDWIRSVRTQKYKYIRNGFPSRPYLQPNNYKDSKAIVQAMRQWHEEGKLDESQALIMSHTREIEELYDLEKDPDELHNLARDAAYGTQLVELRGRLIEWQKRSGDTHGVESPEIYEAEAGAEHLEGGKGNRSPQYQKNLELMKRWHTEKPFVPLSP